MTDKREFNPTILRENDIRGVVGETLFAQDAYFVGLVFGSMLIEKGGKTASVGFDGRISSPALEQALVDGLSSAGVDVIRVGLGPSPMVYYANVAYATDASLMVTGSHNPSNYNGIKMTMLGQPFYADHILELGERAKQGKFKRGTGSVTERNIQSAYVDRLVEDFQGQKSLRVAWDPGNGAAGDALVELTRKLPGTHFLINETIDGTFPAHHPDPTVEENLVQLRELVARERCDIGIGLDGDGDRVGVIDCHGRVLWGDQQLVLLAKDVLADHPGAPIVTDIKASQLFTDEILRMGGEPVLWKSGHSHIKTKMNEIGSPLAGEMSAHIFFKHRYYGYDDALYAAVRMLSLLATEAVPLDAYLDGLPVYQNTPEIRFDCAESRKFLVIEEVKARLAGRTDINVNEIDGVRVSTDKGWWLLRASNTQAALTARCEASDVDELERLKKELAEQLELSSVTLPEILRA